MTHGHIYFRGQKTDATTDVGLAWCGQRGGATSQDTTLPPANIAATTFPAVFVAALLLPMPPSWLHY